MECYNLLQSVCFCDCIYSPFVTLQLCWSDDAYFYVIIVHLLVIIEFKKNNKIL